MKWRNTDSPGIFHHFQMEILNVEISTRTKVEFSLKGREKRRVSYPSPDKDRSVHSRLKSIIGGFWRVSCSIASPRDVSGKSSARPIIFSRLRFTGQPAFQTRPRCVYGVTWLSRLSRVRYSRVSPPRNGDQQTERLSP